METQHTAPKEHFSLDDPVHLLNCRCTYYFFSALSHITIQACPYKDQQSERHYLANVMIQASVPTTLKQAAMNPKTALDTASSSTSETTMLASKLDTTQPQTATNVDSPFVPLRAIAITRMVEVIILELSNSDLRLAQRICKKFQQVILGSLALQRKLFLNPN